VLLRRVIHDRRKLASPDDESRPPVPQYRVCVLTVDDEIWNPPILLDFESDQHAIQQAEQLVAGEDVELWEGRRFVTRVRSKPRQDFGA
jgi:hypothetical protein